MSGKYINWNNGGGFGPDDWRLLWRFIRDYRIETVLEYGCGLSTELMLAMDLLIVSIETREEYADIPGSKIIYAPYPHYPEMNGHYDLGFVDGPGAYEFESKGQKPTRLMSVVHAALYCDYIYLHDGGLEQETVLEGKPAWLKIRGGDSNIIYKRVK